MRTLDDVIRELESYKRLGEGWDGEGTSQPNVDSINHAIAFVNTMKGFTQQYSLPLPIISREDGKVTLYYNTDKLYVDLEFEPTGDPSMDIWDKVTGERTRGTDTSPADLSEEWCAKTFKLIKIGKK